MTMELNFSPSPVNVTTPTMMPAPAQVAPTLSMPIEPPSSALMKPVPRNLRQSEPGARKKSRGMSAVSARRKLVTIDTTEAQNTDSTGEKPHSMKATIEISDRKWYQYLRVSDQTDSTLPKTAVD